ncbi:MAG: LAGLIDADG family homing endonuclease [Nanoarchaeota archaeon]
MINRNEKGRFVNGHIPWHKGKRNVYSEELLKKWSETKKGKHFSPNTEFKKGHIWSKEIEEKRLKNSREKILKKPNLNMDEDLAYILGILKGDGTVFKERGSYRIVLDITSKEVAISFLNSLKNIGLNPRLIQRKPKKGNLKGQKIKYIVRSMSKIFGEWYKNISIKELENLNKKEMISFIRGFYESEGCLYIAKNKYKTISLIISNTNFDLINLCKNLCEKIGIYFNLNGPYENKRQFKNSKQIYALRTAVNSQVHNFLDIINPCIKNLREI